MVYNDLKKAGLEAAVLLCTCQHLLSPPKLQATTGLLRSP